MLKKNKNKTDYILRNSRKFEKSAPETLLLNLDSYSFYDDQLVRTGKSAVNKKKNRHEFRVRDGSGE